MHSELNYYRPQGLYFSVVTRKSEMVLNNFLMVLQGKKIDNLSIYHLVYSSIKLWLVTVVYLTNQGSEKKTILKESFCLWLWSGMNSTRSV